MTRRDFKTIANTLKWAKSQGIDTLGIAQDLAVKFALSNPKFDREKFLKACNLWH